MWASNFGRVNLCSRLWTFGLDNFDWEEQDEFIFQDTIENVIEKLKWKDFYWQTLNEWYEKDKIIWKFEISYYNTAWRYWDSNEYYIIVEYGYHEWARFDIIAHEDGYFSNIYINKAYDKRLKKTIKECEKVFAKYTNPMRRVGGFSDWTSLYEKA